MTEAAGRPRELPGVLDPRRLAAVSATGILNGALSEAFDELAALAARLLDAPLAFLTVVDETRSFWAGCVGVDVSEPGARDNPVEESFCQYVIADREPLIVNDAAIHPRTRDNPSVSAMGVRAWAGYPLMSAGQALGSFCVIDVVPREWTDEQVDLLGVVARAASAQVSLLAVMESERAARAETARVRSTEQVVELRLARLASASMQLSGARSVGDLARIVLEDAMAALETAGGAVGVLNERGSLDVTVSSGLAEQIPDTLRVLPLDSSLLLPMTVRDGRRRLVPDRPTGIAMSPEMAGVFERTDRKAWAFLPLTVADRTLGALAVSWIEEHAFDDAEVVLLDALAAQCAQALNRLQHDRVRRERELAALQLSEALQRSLLTQPPTPDSLEIVVRYQPATAEAQVGGDWYDAFVTADGATMLVIGDVTGHDRNAAAAMAQVRNVLRGLAYEDDGTPSQVLSRLDRTLLGLEVDTLATAILARVEQTADDRAAGVRRLRWSNAGHPPPLLRHPDGHVEVLETEPDLLLGLSHAAARRDETRELAEGSTVLLYTDGLVERRGSDLDDGIAHLAAAFRHLGDLAPKEICDQLIAAVDDDPGIDDDIAILVLRCGPNGRGSTDDPPIGLGDHLWSAAGLR